MPPFRDITGQRFGRLVAQRVDGKTPDGKHLWLCVCDCGGSARCTVTNLRRGVSRSCKCLQREKASAAGKARRTHGGRYTPEYHVWKSMWARCTNPKNDSYADYGAKGITVCDRWLKFENFIADMGKRPSAGYSIDRENNAKGYTPGNCRWATAVQQNRNRPSVNVNLTLGGKTQCVAAWAKELGVSKHMLHGRINAGWSVERALTIRPRKQKNSYVPEAV